MAAGHALAGQRGWVRAEEPCVLRCGKQHRLTGGGERIAGVVVGLRVLMDASASDPPVGCWVPEEGSGAPSSWVMHQRMQRLVTPRVARKATRQVVRNCVIARNEAAAAGKPTACGPADVGHVAALRVRQVVPAA